LSAAVRSFALVLIALPASWIPPAQAQDAPPARIQPHGTTWERLETWRLRVRIDFGPGERVEPGSEPCDARDWSPYASWTGGMVRPISRAETKDPYLGDFIEGETATLLVSTDPGRRYRMILTMGDAVLARGPFRITIGDRVLSDSLRTQAGEFLDLFFDVSEITPRTEIRIDAAPCGSFAANGLAVFVEGLPPSGKKQRTAGLPPAPPPMRADGDSLGERALRKLRAYADYLIETQPNEGGFSHNGNWYECAYPVRTLLWASQLLSEPRYAEAAFDCLDRFLAERRTDGTWAAQYFASRGCPLARGMMEEGRSRNLADVGSLALCLPLASTFTEGDGKGRLLAAARAYADAIVLPAQLPSGAFPNGRFEGVDYAFPYSVATAVQASHLAGLCLATGEERYRQASVRAGLFLAGGVEADGSVRFHPHDKAETLLLPAERVGELFYVIEGILWAHRVADPAARDTLAAALDRYFRGGSLSGLWSDPAAWLRGGNVWERSKRAGILYLLEGFASIRGESEDLRRLTLQVFGALEEPAFARTLGVGADPGTAQEQYSMAATGFAGLGVAGLGDPGTLFGLGPGNRAAGR
jgi:hypothetical protein